MCQLPIIVRNTDLIMPLSSFTWDSLFSITPKRVTGFASWLTSWNNYFSSFGGPLNQTIFTDNILRVLEFRGSPGYASGKNEVTAVSVVFTFSNFYVSAPPYHNVTLNIITTGIPETSKLDTAAYKASIALFVYLRKCIPGEIAYLCLPDICS